MIARIEADHDASASSGRNMAMTFRRQDPVGLVMLTLALTTLGLLALMLWRCGAGLDFTDEGLYLNSIERPWAASFTSTLFGFVYHPLYRLLGADVVLLRQANMLVTFAAATALVLAILQNARQNGEPCRPIGREDILPAIVLAAPSLAFYRVWIASPGYNSLNLQGLIIALTGVTLLTGGPSQNGRAISALGPAILTGLGGWMVFMAKPTSAILLAATTGLVVLSRPRLALYFVAFSAATAFALLLMTAFLIDGGVASFAARIAESMAVLRALAPDYDAWSAFRLDPLKFNASEIRAFWAILVAALMLSTIVAVFPKSRAATVLATGALAAAASVYWLLDPQSLSAMTWVRPASGMLLAAAPGGIAIMIAATALALRRMPRPAEVALTLALLVAPYTFAYGTKSNIFHIAPAAFTMITVAAAYALHKALDPARARAVSAILGAAGLAVTTLVVTGAMERPYRLSAPLRLQETVLTVGQGQSRIRVDPATARYIEAFRRTIGARDRVAPGVIDVTGASPGALFAAGAFPVGLPWMIGDLPGSEIVATGALRKVDCQTLAASWILSEENGERALPSAVLERIGRQLRPTIELESPHGIQALTPPEGDVSAAATRCQALRR